MISVIIPIRNELFLSDRIESHIERLPSCEVIAIDTSEKVSEINPQGKYAYHHCPNLRYRSEAMNFGASIAKGDIFIFLHIDCKLRDAQLHEIQNAIETGAVGGAFQKHYEPSTSVRKIQSAFLNFFSRNFQWYVTGTNTIFVDRSAFKTLHGFREYPLFEDMDFWSRLVRSRDARILQSKAVVSSRRYHSLLGIPQMCRNTFLYILYLVSVPPRILAKLY